MAKETNRSTASLRAVHRIEISDGGETGVILPGEVFSLPEGRERERLLQLAAATVVDEMALPLAQ